jgi:hypothetical protein
MEIEPIYNLDLFKGSKGENGRWNPSQKYFAVMMLDCDKRERGGVETPRYTYYSEMLNVPLTTLKNWYADKEGIAKESSAIAKSAIQTAQMQLAISIPNIVTKLNERVNSDEMKDSDLINLMREFINKMRLLGNNSTENVQHNHQHFVPIVPKNLDK